MAKVSVYHIVAALIAKIVELALWTEIISQEPNLLEMSVIAPIKSQVKAKASTIHLSRWETPATMPPIISPTKMLLYLMRE